MKQIVHYPLSSPTVNPLDTPIISFSCGNYGNYLDPNSILLNFTFTNNDSTNAQVLDGSGYSVIDRVVVQSSGAILSDLQNYAPWAQVILDTQSGVGKSGFMSTFAGSAINGTQTVYTGANNASTTTTVQTTIPENSANAVRQGASVAVGASTNITLPLIGTFFNGSDKLIPVGALTDLQIQFYISSGYNAVYGGAASLAGSAATAWTLTNFYITANYVELDASAQKMIDDSLGGVFKWSSELWRSYNFTLGSGSADNVIVPHKSESVKGIIAIARPAANINNYNKYSTTSRLCPYANSTTGGTSSFFITIGSEAYPNIPIRNTAQHAVEMLKFYHSVNNPDSYNNTQIDYANWNAQDSTNPITMGAFANFLNLEAYSNKSGVLHSGVPVVGGTTMVLNQNYATNATVQTAMTGALQTTFVHYDCICTVKDGQLEVAF
jgi:hypothetical protein